MAAREIDPPLVDAGSTADRQRSPRAPFVRRAALPLGGAAISALCFWLAVRHVSLASVHASLDEADWVWLVPATALAYATMAARAVRWRFLFWEPEAISTWESVKAVNLGLMFNNILPSRAGEVPRALALARAEGLSRVEVLATIVVERALDVLSIAVAGVVAWPWFPHAGWIHALGILCAGILGGFVVVAAVVAPLRGRARVLVARLLRRLPFFGEAHADGVAAALARGIRILADPRRLAQALALSALVWVVAGLSILVLYPGFGLRVDSSSCWLILVATSLAMTVPSTSGALGVYEAAVQASLVAAGVASGPALSFALVLHAVNFVPVSLTGALAAWASVGGLRRARVSALVR